MKTTYALLDDDHVFTTWLNDVVRKVSPLLTHVGSYSDTIAAASGITRLKPDILFLDMQIDCFDGLELLDLLDYQPLTIAVSGSEEYADRAKQVGVLEYLTKPVQEGALEAAVGRALWLIRAEKTRQEIKLRQSH